ncbi:bifunctional NAD(P)/FAD-dependent oxidoreductase/class I SAM-dependent methyltransferase [Cellulomonas fimi]|uniref:Methyltransferase type 12 n=1 Tax=Cellulomonas fimi (strain ATCC 484 / DSM 20113 / JCM 1341 / CCUG 24087 / LMG 16345 / NBRC 15513 / NCIMB 8980 / NCTC 7547 / NRS-133) TaxID=590998 RepID=F4H162_CELFA|nr:bifunctional NAD(P)/FAD-dependent oxidoreductase/class I SAM-dependent methyltransferase [Cellulomonas fimi]AEE47431.1 Methyltransferase type 12 [Cellulomonas fimi ATCC 484]NNH05592.1 NAD(P)/FAD-dependent oxidoreductase [Cellulomonas fimi]VEH36198.1 Thioredoxin reductase [Cellulomonas fimi]
MDERYDVVVVGGGAAGLSGALTLARARRSVLVVDAGTPRNAPAAHAHGMLTRDGTPPLEILAAGRAEVQRYGAHVEPGSVVAVHQEDGAFTVELADGRSVVARAVLNATGLRDELPDVPGLAERWGSDVLHCPYCHGWEVRDRPVVVLGTTPLAAHAALLWRQWTPDVTLVRHTAPPLGDDDAQRLAARGVRVLDTAVTGVDGPPGDLAVHLADGGTVPAAAVVAPTRLVANAEHLAPLGLHPVPLEVGGHEIGRAVPADPSGATALPGVWLAGNVTDLRATVVVAAAAGTTAAAALNADLVLQDADAAVAAAHDAHVTGHGADGVRHGKGTAGRHTDPVTGVELPEELRGMFAPDFWEERYSGATHVWSGRPNATLVAEVADLPRGRALDVAAGEGGDAVWLAEQGWHVTATDWAPAGLARGAAAAAERGVGDRVTWRQADITSDDGWDDEPYDLVTSHYLHLPPALRTTAVRRLASLVRPGGTLLVVGHHADDLSTAVHRPDVPELFADAVELATLLDPAAWELVTVEARPRTATDPEGREVVLHDAILRARRR